MDAPTLFLIPSPLGECDFTAIFPAVHQTVINQCSAFIVEDLRTARRFLRKAGFTKPFDEVELFELNKFTRENELNDFLKPCAAGKHVGLMSEAGTPCVADPGNKVVALAHRQNIRVTPLVGPNSIILALMASGFNGQNFTFNGYLPIEQQKREKELQFIENLLVKNNQTQIFIETPYRNNHLMESILKVCQPFTKLCVAVNLTTEKEQIITTTIAKWRKTTFDFHKQPAIFLLGK